MAFVAVSSWNRTPAEAAVARKGEMLSEVPSSLEIGSVWAESLKLREPTNVAGVAYQSDSIDVFFGPRATDAFIQAQVVALLYPRGYTCSRRVGTRD